MRSAALFANNASYKSVEWRKTRDAGAYFSVVSIKSVYSVQQRYILLGSKLCFT